MRTSKRCRFVYDGHNGQGTGTLAAAHKSLVRYAEVIRTHCASLAR